MVREAVATPRHLVARWSGDVPMYATLAAVLEASAKAHLDGWVVDVTHSSATPTTRYEAFVRKTLDFFRAVRALPDGAEVVLTDVDIMVTRDPAHVFERDFDIAVTTRGDLDTLNSGVIFLRRSDAVVKFLERWFRLTAKKRNPGGKGKGQRYSDQDALIALLGQRHGLSVVQLPCLEYNCQQNTWAHYNERTCFVHIKSDLRKHLVSGSPLHSPGAERMAEMWRIWHHEVFGVGAESGETEAPTVEPVSNTSAVDELVAQHTRRELTAIGEGLGLTMRGNKVALATLIVEAQGAGVDVGEGGIGG